jgi:hypothetical protein
MAEPAMSSSVPMHAVGGNTGRSLLRVIAGIFVHVDSMGQACKGIDGYIDFYNARRPHQAHLGRTPDMVYYKTLTPMQTAA